MLQEWQMHSVAAECHVSSTDSDHAKGDFLHIMDTWFSADSHSWELLQKMLPQLEVVAWKRAMKNRTATSPLSRVTSNAKGMVSVDAPMLSLAGLTAVTNKWTPTAKLHLPSHGTTPYIVGECFQNINKFYDHLYKLLAVRASKVWQPYNNVSF